MKEVIRKNPDGTLTVSLEHPVKASKIVNKESVEEEYTEIQFRQFSFGDFKALADQNFKNDNQEAYFLVQRLSVGFPTPAFNEICGADLERCLVAVQSFLPKSQET